MVLAPASNGSFYILGIDANAASDCSATVQSAIDIIHATYNGGFLWFPRPGNYLFTSGITIKGGVTLMGHGKNNTLLNFQNADVDCVTLSSNVQYGGMRDLFVAGISGSSGTKNTVTISDNVPAIIQRCQIWGGMTALLNKGTDGTIEDCFISGNSSCSIKSNGANWYRRCKIDTASTAFTVTNAYLQTGVGPVPGVIENHFDQCDFSGSNYTNSIVINSTDSQAITTFTGCVIGAPVNIIQHQFSMFAACEIGSATFTTPVNTAVTGCVKLGSAMSITNATKAGNINIS